MIHVHAGLPLSLPPMAMMSSDLQVRHDRLDRRGPVLAAAAGAVAIVAVGEWLAPFNYSDAHFAIDFFVPELLATAWLAIVTLLWFPAQALGWRRPQWQPSTWHWPLVLLLLASVGAWVATRLTLPTGTDLQSAMSWQIARTTLLVGVNEEWLFRGLLLVAFCRWWGPRRGALSALALFGAFHGLNLLAGMPPGVALAQVVLATLLGSIFLQAAQAGRSLWWPALAHGVYDWALIDMGRLRALGATSWAFAAVPALGLVLGLVCLAQLLRHPVGEPYANP
jgi:membrane protease YdiL (CAAX protease family)